MKRIILLGVSIVFGALPSFAQMNVKELIDSIDWNATENEIIEKYSSMVMSREHFYNEHYKATFDYCIAPVMIGSQKMTASVAVDSITRKLHSLHLTPTNETGEIIEGFGKDVDALEFSKNMDTALIASFGEPDYVSNEINDKYLPNLDRKWYKENIIIEVSHTILRSRGEQLYTLRVKRIAQSSEPDFRIARWGDSRASIMEKEGKPNLAPLDRLYVFPDCVADMNCEVAYIFTQDKLTMAKYVFKESHTNKKAAIRAIQDTSRCRRGAAC